MLVSRQCELEQNPWSISKLETIFHKPSTNTRMSNNYEPPLSTQSDWQGQYSSFLPPGDTNIFSQPYDHVASSTDNSEVQAQPRSATASSNPLDIENLKSEPLSLSGSPLEHRRSVDPLGLRQPRVASPIPEHPEEMGEHYSQKPSESLHDESLSTTETPGMSLRSNPLSSVSSTGQPSDVPANGTQTTIKDEDNEVLDDEDMMEGDGERDAPTQPQTAAERTAQRRKMKRFRLTHQQTRFLMSEFAKQPHPDAAHRERLSREIPGLSPRQVQVWFQNRRAKIKRLTADDRDRMIKMRAVPDDFDNVQALHSPYGAVHGLGTPLTSPVDFAASAYADHMMRPLMVDVRRSEGEEHLSPTGLSPAFGSIGFSPSASLNNPDILSPLSTGSGDRYGYTGHLSTPLSAGPRTSNPYARPPTLDTSMSMHGHHSRHSIRPLQPLQLREAMTRSRSDSLQSPLRTSMSWKGDAIDYTTYHGGSTSPQMGGRQTSAYPDPLGESSTSGLSGYDSSTYSSSTVQSPTHMSYPTFNSSSMQNSQGRSRIRAASATLPLGLDLRTQFRSVSTSHNMQSTTSPGSRNTSSNQLGGISSSYSNYPTAPLTAPMDFLPRTPGFRSSGTDYSMPQMSAPIAPSNDFAQAFSSMSSSRTPMRDTFGGGGSLSLGGTSQSSIDKRDEYSGDGGMSSSIKRKRSFTGPSSATSTGQSTYGNTT